MGWRTRGGEAQGVRCMFENGDVNPRRHPGTVYHHRACPFSRARSRSRARTKDRRLKIDLRPIVRFRAVDLWFEHENENKREKGQARSVSYSYSSLLLILILIPRYASRLPPAARGLRP